jgi:uncharacterized protein YbaP (TraB family)
MLKTLFRRTLALLGLAALAGCTTPGTVEGPSGRPALWQLSDKDTTIYLFGTIHLLPADYDWRSPKLEEALAGSQSLVIETVVDDKNPAALVGQLQRLGFRPGLPPLLERVAPEKRPALQAAMAKSGLPLTAFDRMETWTAAFVLLGNQFKDLGLVSSAGVETVLRGVFAQAGKPVGELETNAEQLGLFDTLPEAAQRSLLEGAIDTPTDMRAQFTSMLDAWVRGDVESIAATFNQDLASSPDLRDALLRRRNANWTNWLARRMATPGSVFVAVGAGHLAGSDSVIAMLQKSGYRVRRVQ